MTEAEPPEDVSAQIHARIEEIAAFRDSSLDYDKEGLDLPSTKSVRIFQVGLAWRMEELSRSAISLMTAGDSIAALCLMRAATETAAATWYVKELIERQIKNPLPDTELKKDVARLVMGAKMWEDVPQAINVMTFLRHAEREFPGILTGYAIMSEFAHPNFGGAVALYTKRDGATRHRNFERGARTAGEGTHGLHVFLATLLVALAAQRQIRTLFPAYILACKAATTMKAEMLPTANDSKASA